MLYKANPKRYETMKYNRCGDSGILLPAISLGLWHNFGDVTQVEISRQMLHTAFDHGITHFDLANNYGPPPGSAELNFGRILKEDFKSYRDELIISTKAGYYMWPGPYGDRGSRKYLMASINQSLKRMELEYVDIFYHHRPDADTPLEETMLALSDIVRQGKALYVGLSNYRSREAKEAIRLLNEMGTPCLIHQPSYSMLNRWVETDGLLDLLETEGVGCIPFSPLAKGVLTNRYLNGIPSDSRAGGSSSFLSPDDITEPLLDKVRALNAIAEERGQTMAELAISWILRKPQITSVLIGASRPEQIIDCVGALSHPDITASELARIEAILAR